MCLPKLEHSFAMFAGILMFSSLFTASACTSIIVGKNRTTDGSVLLAHNEDIDDRCPQILEKVSRKYHRPDDVYKLFSGGSLPQPEVTFAYIASKIYNKNIVPGDYTTGVNEFQVSVANNLAICRGVDANTDLVVHGGLIWSEFTQLALERSRSAREAVALIGDLCESRQLSHDSGTMFAVADPNEGWWIEIARGGQWIAQRVSDDDVVMRANFYQIGVVDLNDSSKILHSSSLVTHALRKGWYDPRIDGPFNFAAVYGHPDFQNVDFNTLRIRMVDQFFHDGSLVDPAKLFKLLRWTYEDTDIYRCDPKTGSPFHTENYTIARMETEISSVAQLRHFIPDEIGALMWWSLATPKMSVYIPYYSGTTSIYKPYTNAGNQYSKDSAYWRFRELSMRADKKYAKTIQYISETWQAFETELFLQQAPLESEAISRLNSRGAAAAQKYLTTYSNGQAAKAFEASLELTKKIKTGR